jgi:dTDP-4-dehydrorhamnose reductase
MKTKVLILGSTGMLGHQVFYNLINDKSFDVYDLSFRNKLRPETIICDVTDFEKLAEVILKIKPNVIVNCIGILIKGANDNPKNAILLNSYLPHWLASQSDQINAKLIHISTDCVFSGSRGSYSENDFRDADDVYGRSKALGEVNSGKHLTIRTSIIGPELKENGEGLFHWFLNQKGDINGFTKAFWGGVTTHECARAINYSIQNEISGLYNLTNGEKISKYEMLIEFNRILKRRDVKIHRIGGKHVDKSLISNRFEIKYKVPGFKIMFEDMVLNMNSNSHLYNHYNF